MGRVWWILRGLGFATVVGIAIIRPVIDAVGDALREQRGSGMAVTRAELNRREAENAGSPAHVLAEEDGSYSAAPWIGGDTDRLRARRAQAPGTVTRMG